MVKFRLHQYVAVDGTAGGYGEPSFYIGNVRKIEIGVDGIVYFVQFAPGATWVQHQEAELFEAAVLVSPQVEELIIRDKTVVEIEPVVEGYQYIDKSDGCIVTVVRVTKGSVSFVPRGLGRTRPRTIPFEEFRAGYRFYQEG